jgi:hypothetical protein
MLERARARDHRFSPTRSAADGGAKLDYRACETGEFQERVSHTLNFSRLGLLGGTTELR